MTNCALRFNINIRGYVTFGVIMKFTLLNLKNLLLFSGIIIGFTNPINADNYNSNDTDSTKYNDYSWSSTKTNKYKSKFGFENKDEDKPCYGPNCKNKKKYFQDDYDVKHNRYESDFDLKNKNEPCIGEDCNSKSDYDIKRNKYKSDFDLKNENKPCIGYDCDNYSDYKYDNFDCLDEFDKEFNAGIGLDVPCTGPECYNECTGPDCEKSNKPVFMSSVYSSSYSSVTDSNGTRVSQNQYGMFDNGNTKYEEREASNGDSNSGKVNTKYRNKTFDKKSSKKLLGDNKSFDENFDDFVSGKRDDRHMSYNKFVKNTAKFNNNNLLPSDNKRIESNTKQLPDSNYYNKYNNKDNLDRNIYKTSYNMNTLPEEDVE